MKKLYKMIPAMALLWNISVSAGSAQESIPSFQDVSETFWGAGAISWGIRQNMISGYPDGTFRPNQSVKESEFLSMLLHYYANGSSKLALDSAGSHWAEGVYKRAKEYHLPISEKPSNKWIKRGEVAKLISASQGLNFNTNNAVQFLYNHGISNGRKGTAELGDFGKESYLTRAEAVQFIKNVADKGMTVLKPSPVDPSKPLLPTNTQLFPFTGENRLIGFKNLSGKVWVDPQFSSVGEFKEGLAAVFFNGKWGFMDSNGETLIPLKFDEVRNFSDGYAAVRIGTEFGYIDKTGKAAIPLQFQTAVYSTNSSELNIHDVDFHDGYAAIKLGDKFGLINKSGKLVTQQKFDFIGPVREGLARVTLNGKSGYLHTTGKMAIKPQFLIANDFYEGLAAVSLDGKSYGYIDKSGKYAIKANLILQGLNYNYSGPPVPFDFHEGLAKVMKEGKFGFIDNTGKMVIPPQVDALNRTNDTVSDFANNFAMVRMGYRFGFMSKSGEISIPAQYDGARPFADDAAAVLLKGKWGFIDKNGREIIKPQFSEAQSFQQGIALVAVDGPNGSRDYFYIDKSGKRLE